MRTTLTALFILVAIGVCGYYSTIRVQAWTRTAEFERRMESGARATRAYLVTLAADGRVYEGMNQREFISQVGAASPVSTKVWLYYSTGPDLLVEARFAPDQNGEQPGLTHLFVHDRGRGRDSLLSLSK